MSATPAWQGGATAGTPWQGGVQGGVVCDTLRLESPWGAVKKPPICLIISGPHPQKQHILHIPKILPQIQGMSTTFGMSTLNVQKKFIIIFIIYI